MRIFEIVSFPIVSMKSRNGPISRKRCWIGGFGKIEMTGVLDGEVGDFEGDFEGDFGGGGGKFV